MDGAGEVASPKMRARGKSNSSFSIGTLISRAAARTGSGDGNDDPAAKTTNDNGILAFQGLTRSKSSHLDPVAIRRAIECTSAMSADSGAEHPDVQSYLDAHPWNISRSPTPPLPIGSTRRAEVYSPSIYTRPGTSAEDAPLPAIPHDLNATLNIEWPLKPPQEQVQTIFEPSKPSLSPETLQNKPLPPTPITETATTSSASPIRSPPKKTVKKRRSIFRFLRPGSRRQQIRSISSPMLLTRPSTSRSGAQDGPSDERDRRDTLTVQYELTENPTHRRSFTASYFPQERRPTLAEYERSLTAGGDDRRRPSVITPSAVSVPNLQTLHDISEDEVEGEKSSRLRRRLSRAHALDEAGKTLMGQALKKHQQEKAMFRSESKRRESLALQSGQPPIFKSSFGPSTIGSSLPPPSIEEHNELLDPLDQAGLKPSGSVGTLLEPPNAGAATPVRKPSLITTFDEHSSRLHQTPTASSVSPSQLPKSPTSPRIGTSLASWSKFPSHTRVERCSSAGRSDKVITRDFANAETSAPPPISPLSKSSTIRGSRKSNRSLIKSPSRAFSNIVQYYKDMLSRGEGFRGANRRTSISANTGSVAHPELEIVSPIPGAEAHHHHMNHAHLHDLDQHIERSIAEHVHPPHHKTPSPPAAPPVTEGLFNNQTFDLHPHAHTTLPADDDEEGPGPLDGAAEWSRQYQAACLPQRPVSSESKSSAVSSVRVRKFPSVTVLDDWKGHRASVSLLSRDGRKRSCGGLERGSTVDLLEELVRREREGRERALGLGVKLDEAAAG